MGRIPPPSCTKVVGWPRPDATNRRAPSGRRFIGTAFSCRRRLGPFVLHLLEAAADLRRTEPAVAAEGADSGDLACTCPPGNGLRVHPEERCHFGRCEECICLRFSHVSGPLLKVRFVLKVRPVLVVSR